MLFCQDESLVAECGINSGGCHRGAYDRLKAVYRFVCGGFFVRRGVSHFLSTPLGGALGGCLRGAYG